MSTYYRGETVIVTGTLTDNASADFNLADFTTFSATITDSNGQSYTYSVAESTVAINSGDANSYYFEITPAQSSVLLGAVECVITTTFVDGTYSITTTDIAKFEVGKWQ